MKLFLASELKHPNTFSKLKEFIGGFEGKSIAYIPTAANGEGWNQWKDGGTWNLVKNTKADITIVQLEEYESRDPIDDIKGKDILIVAGGYTGYLLYWMRKTKLNLKLKELLDSGTIYVGTSAGCMATGTDMNFVEWYLGEGEPGAGCIPGLGLVDFNFYPHYKDYHYDQIKENFLGEKIYLVKDGEAIIVEDKNITIIGEQRIIEN